MPKSESIDNRARPLLAVVIAAALLVGGLAYRFLQQPAPTPSGAIAALSTPRSIASTLMLVALATGYSHTCGLTSSGKAYCWGWNSEGELGIGEVTSSISSPTAVNGGLEFVVMTVGTSHTCGLTRAGAAFCWGGNPFGELGDGTRDMRLSPGAVTGGLTFVALTARGSHTCGLTRSGAAYCWGDNEEGELGDGTLTSRTTPVAVLGGLSFAALSAGASHTCALTSSAAAYCWGDNRVAQLGDGTMNSRLNPGAVSGGLAFVGLSAGYHHTCGLTSDGAAYCWGFNSFGQLGDGDTTDRVRPVAVKGGLIFVALSAGGDHTCGLTKNGAAYCWGATIFGELGDGTFRAETGSYGRWRPVLVAGGLVFSRLSAGSSHTCGLTGSGAAYCWGNNTSAQLRDGTRRSRATPGAVQNGP